MNARSPVILSAVAVLCLSATAAHGQQKVYRWVDDEGVVQYGDRVPPRYAHIDRDVLNRHGVAIDSEEGEVTAEERAELERVQAAEDEVARVAAAEAQRDRMLLDTYLTVGDIEDLRDRRLELLSSQIQVTELYLTNLRKRLVKLQREAGNYQPYSERENAPPVPENLVLDLSRTLASIGLYEQTLDKTRADQDVLRTAFGLDIERFEVLKGG